MNDSETPNDGSTNVDNVVPGQALATVDEGTSDKDAELAERVRIDGLCLEARRANEPYRSIANRLQISVGRAHRGVERALAEEPGIDLDIERNIMAGQLERGITQVMTIMLTDTNKDRRLRAADRLVALIDRKAKLIGADAPVLKHVEVTVVTQEAIDAELARLDRELAAAGVDVSLLPSVEQLAEAIEATATVQTPANANGLLP